MLSLAEFKEKLTFAGVAKWTESPSVETFWRFEMKASASQIWDYISDTSRFNRELGFNSRNQIEDGGKMLVSTRMVGFRQEWVEEPWTWLVGQTITSGRTYQRGMAKRVYSVFHIDSATADDRRFVYVYFGWTPKNVLWAKFLSATGGVMQKKFAVNFAKIDAHFADLSKIGVKALGQPPPAMDAAATKKVDAIAVELQSRRQNVEAISRLTNFVKSGDDFDLETIRVIPLSRKWQIDEADLLKTCLHSTRLGLLNISWDVICPHCRGSRFSAESLGDIPEMANCGICEIDFSTSDENSIEVVFHVHESIRKVEKQMYCAAEPAKKNHIKIQQSVEPGKELRVKAEFSEGLYRVRVIGEAGEARVEIGQRFERKFYDHSNDVDAKLNPNCEIAYTNRTERAVGFVFEELWWERNALHPGQILSLPDFRDLFSEDHLSSNVKLFLGEQTILFTDIVGSTNFYASQGDAKAFADVRAHFQEVYQMVLANQGVVVKTIGDAVMAAFPSTSQAVRAGVEIQKKFSHDRADTALRLRVSIHAGPVIAVKLNTGLDYFGNTVNLAAKIQSCAGGGEIALTERVYKAFEAVEGQPFPVMIRHNKRDGADITNVHVLNVSGGAKTQAAA
ncbi:hypothetical protein BH10BDE1_BH10BDE1_13600 [soil metagenome]